MNPNNRLLIRLTIDDVERDLAQFNVLHGKNDIGKKARRLMMSNVEIHRDDLDN